MRRTSLALAISLLVLLASAPQASAWTTRNHGHLATNVFDKLPDLYKENFDDSMLYSAAIAPDDWRQNGWPVHQYGTASASSSAAGHPPGAAFDGDFNTYWQAGNAGDGENLTIDLEVAYPVNEIKIYGVENKADLQILYSSDNTTWRTLSTVSDAWHIERYGEGNREFGYRNYRFWRFRATGLPAGSYFKVTEIELLATADNAHRSDWCKERLRYWFSKAENNYRAGNHDNALFELGIASHYLSDAMTLVHNKDLWNENAALGFDNKNSEWVNESPSGWSRHKHYEESVRYHEPGYSIKAGGVVLTPKNYRNTLENYIDNYLIPYIENYEARVQTNWFYWLSTRDANHAKSALDNATQLFYDAWISMMYEYTGVPPGGGGGFGAYGSEGAQASVVEAEPSQAPILVLLFGGLLSLFTATFILRKGKPLKRRFRLRRDERGITPVIGAILVIALLTIAGMTIVSSWIPEQERKSEADHMDAIRDAWQELQSAILNHENRTIKVKMGADPASVFGLFGQSMNPGHIQVNPAKWVKRIAPVADMYVSQSGGSGTENYLFAQSNANNNKRAFLRFDLSALPPDANIVEARLLVFSDVSKYPNLYYPEGAPRPVTGYSNITQLLEIRKVDNDTWSETSPPAWPGPTPGDGLVNGDWPWENTWEISYDNMWYTFNLTDYVKAERNANDNLVSICIKAVKENSSLLRYAIINSKENPYRRPHLLVVYERANVAGVPTYDDNWGSIADGGGVVFEARNKHYDDYTFAFESGGLIMERYGSGTLMISNPDLVVPIVIENGDNIQIYVNRYRIVNSGRFSSTGTATLTVTVRENPELGRSLHVDNLTVAVRSDYPEAWRGTHPLVVGGYFTDLAGRFDSAGSLDYIFEFWDSDTGDISKRDFYINAITIFGRHQGPVIGGSASVCPVDKDIFYTERVYDVRVDISMA